MAIGTATFAFWLPVFVHQHHIGLAYEAPSSVHEKITFVILILLQFMPVRTTLVQTSFFATFVLAAAVMTVRSNAWRSDAFALGALFAAVLLVLAGANLTVVRYVLPFCALLYVFIGAVFSEFAARAAREDPAAWRRWGILATALIAAFFFAGDAAFALENSAVPRSGIASFSREPLEASTLYVLSPDYIAPAFAFYERERDVRYMGFARLHEPQIYTLDGYEALWNDPNAVDKAVEAIARDRSRYRYLDLLTDDAAHDQYRVPFGKTWELLAELKTRYRLLEHRHYPGRWEPISVYRFLLE